MPAYATHLIGSEETAAGTRLFRFEKPEGFQFKAGQYVNLTLIAPPETDEEGNSRAFTIASAPHEAEIAIATRMRESAFKRSLMKLAPDAEVKVKGPFGSFVLPSESTRPVVFLAGGIGITPFLSMIKYASREKLPHELILFYSNRKREEAAFLEELHTLERENGKFKMVATFTGGTPSGETWEGETGHITRDMLARHLPDSALPVYYAAGPPAMVENMQSLLREAQIPEAQVRTESFDGYA